MAKSGKPVQFPNEFIGRFVSDASFRKKVFANPRTVEFDGMKLSAEQIAAIKSLDPKDLERTLRAFGDDYTDYVLA